MNFNTRNAYNEWGGKSLYASNIPNDPHWAVAVSFLRPFDATHGLGVNFWEQYEIICQLICDGFDPEFITEWDIDSDPAILNFYNIVILAGHHEYISRNVYDALEAHHYRGRHLAFFSGNDIWWQVRFEDDGDKMVSYKGYALNEDPLMRVDNSLVTTWWHSYPVYRPHDALRGNIYTPYSWCFEKEDYIMQNCNHFAFEGTGLHNGDVFGSKVASGETDYIGFNSPDVDVLLSARRARVLPGYEDYVPMDFIDAAAVYYEDSPEYGFPNGRGGQVFSAGTHCGWGTAFIDTSPNYLTVRKVTRNIIQHMVDSPPAATGFEQLSLFALYWLSQCDSPDWCEYMDIDMKHTVDMKDFAHLANMWAGE